jgi:uncharacterized protein YcbK (DUF882 family)
MNIWKIGGPETYSITIRGCLICFTILRRNSGIPDDEVNVVSGYRSPWSNEFLRRHGHHVARHSLHTQAMAVDIRISGVSTSSLRDAALALHRGGVGYYADSAFVHVDVGRARRWSE